MLIGFSSNLKLKLRGPNQNQKYSKQRRHPMDEDIKILKVEYLSNNCSNFPQILNLGNQTKITNAGKEDDHRGKKTQKY